MNRMKYVMFYDDTFVIFDDIIRHTDFSRIKKIISAGFIQFYMDEEERRLKVHCFGESVSLKIKSREQEDADIINKYMRGY